jgi:hypothetical protein
MKNVLKRGAKLLFALTVSLATATVPVQAETVSNDGYASMWFWGAAGQFATGNSAPIEILSVGGVPAYCIQPTQLVSTDDEAYSTSSIK